MATYPVLEHRAGRTSRWLRENRIRIALSIAIVETILVVTSVLQWRWALLIAGAVFAFHFFVGRRARFASIRELSWTAAISQTVPVIIPFVVALVSALVAVAIVAAAIVVLALVFLGRR